MRAKLTIRQPELTLYGDVARVSCSVTETSVEGRSVDRIITFDVEKRWRKYLVTENINAYLIGCLPYAMRNRMDIELLAPVSSDILHGIEMYLVPHLAKYDDRLYPTKIHASKIEHKNTKSYGGVGTGMSMGVDSLFTVNQYIDPVYKNLKLSHLFVEQVGDLVKGLSSTKHKRNVNKNTVDEVAKFIGLPVVYVYSNFRRMFRMKHYHTHTYTAMFNVHMMAKLFKVYFYSSTEDFSHFSLIDNSTHDAALYELLSLQALSTSSLKLMSGGASSDRIEKTNLLAGDRVARMFLRVCLEEESNCGRCMKCRRTLLTLDMQGNLDRFRRVFNVDDYRQERVEYLKWLIRSYHKDSHGVSVKDLYDFFYNNEKKTMERLEGLYLDSYEPMASPRVLYARDDAIKVDPSTGAVCGIGYKKGEKAHFVDKLYVRGVCYLRSNEDSSRGADCAVAIDQLSVDKP